MSDDDVARRQGAEQRSAGSDMAGAFEASPGQGPIPPSQITGHFSDDNPDMVQFVDAEGTRLGVTPANEPYAQIVEEMTSEDARTIYRDLVLVRRIDAEGHALQRQGELGLWPSLLGQEAAQVGAGRALRPQDHAFPGYREHGVAWCKGVPPENVLGMFRGVNHGGWDSKENNFHLHDRHRQPDAPRHGLRDGRAA